MIGLIAFRISGDRTRLDAPSAAVRTSQPSRTGPNRRPTLNVPNRWIENRRDQHDHGDRNDERFETVAHDFESLDGREDADRRRDHSVAVEERRAEQTEEHEPLAATPLPVVRGDRAP